ncbi:MAG: RNA methyltransferase [Muribaculaceae bacterium]|nr:RNA methyltransferase [Muribaculaceae bacterium]
MITYIESLDHPGVEVYSRLTERALARGDSAAGSVFVAESPKVIKVALDAGYRPVSMLCEQRHITGDAAEIVAREPDMEVFTGSPQLLEQLTGYRLTRGVLCAMRRPQPPALEGLCADARLVGVLDGVCDTTNIGSIFRSAAALGVDALLLTPGTCDPFNRRAVRVSMGSVFLVPWTWLPATDWQQTLRSLGFKTVALALRDDSVAIDGPELAAAPRLAMVLGTEGDGLSRQVIAQADYVARIPMANNVDSLNVGAAAAIAFWQLRRR